MKGGNLRFVARKMRELAAELEEEKVDVRKEDRTIRPFTIPFQEGVVGDILLLSSVSIFKKGKIKKASYPARPLLDDRGCLYNPALNSA